MRYGRRRERGIAGSRAEAQKGSGSQVQVRAQVFGAGEVESGVEGNGLDRALTDRGDLTQSTRRSHQLTKEWTRARVGLVGVRGREDGRIDGGREWR